MNAFRCLRVVARPATSVTTLLRPFVGRIVLPQKPTTPSSSRSISMLSMRRPILSMSTLPSSAPNSIPSSEALDLAPKISSHPGLATTQVRCGPRDTFNPSHFVRKRRHGFLNRLRTKNGRKLLMRRIKKGRWNLSH